VERGVEGDERMTSGKGTSLVTLESQAGSLVAEKTKISQQPGLQGLW
jgi:hypothetical protein